MTWTPMPIRSIPGALALSTFRLAGLNRQLAPFGAQACRVRELFLVSGAAAAWSDGQLASVLQWDAVAAPSASAIAQRFVSPRLGTRSPWSSKATDILSRCGLDVGRVERVLVYEFNKWPAEHNSAEAIEALLHDPMTQSVFVEHAQLEQIFATPECAPLAFIGVDGHSLQAANLGLGLSLSADEIEYLKLRFVELGRDATDAELMMFAQANSEHCRHKIFNARWHIDDEPRDLSLFQHIKHTHACTPAGTLSAYHDNAAVLEGHPAMRFFADATDAFVSVPEAVHIAIKVETHNHPTAIAPYAGAATGAGGEIRDEGATGRGAKPKAGLTGFSVSYLRFADAPAPWEIDRALPPHMASALRIMTEAPLGAAAFNNEFGRPALGGYFRSFEQFEPGANSGFAYDKPIMIAGGIGAVRPMHVDKGRLAPGDCVIVLGGPAMLIGLGGGAASSQASGSANAARDFASVQRDNAEMERRCQELIDRCTAMGEANPIVSIHDVGAGGLSNAIPELLNDSAVGGNIDLGAVPNDDPGMSPMQIWCNESQERYVLGVHPSNLSKLLRMAERERCPCVQVGTATAERHLRVVLNAAAVIDLPMDVLFGKAPKMQREATALVPSPGAAFDFESLDAAAALERVLRFPGVGSKQCLITIGDRTVGGLSHRDPMVGPWQTPVADVAVTLADFEGYSGEAFAIAERAPIAVLNAAAAARMAVGEALTNVLAAPIAALSEIKLSANWMAAVGDPVMDGALYAAVEAVGRDLCPALDLSIPVGKDSMSMRARWTDAAGGTQTSRAPISLVISAFARVADVRNTLDPQLRGTVGQSSIWLFDLGAARPRLGTSILAQAHGAIGTAAPDLDDVVAFRRGIEWLMRAKHAGWIRAWHDRSDGGTLLSALEMAFAARAGLEIEIEAGRSAIGDLFSEELGVLIEIDDAAIETVMASAQSAAVADQLRKLGAATATPQLSVRQGDNLLIDRPMGEVIAAWGECSWRIMRGRDNPECADAEYAALADYAAPGLVELPSFNLDSELAAPAVRTGAKPRVAILREQGVNGQVEMAAAFVRAGFDAVDVHMSDLESGRHQLKDFHGLAACGGFSYGDVLGAGQGWAKGIAQQAALAETFREFFADPARFTLGVCNGCQMLSGLRDLIPGAEGWPRFLRNHSEQYEARLVQVEVLDSPSVLLAGMAGSRLPIVVSHGEGRADWGPAGMQENARVAMRFVQANGNCATAYPGNPNASPGGYTGFTTDNGRSLILMPHPERIFRRVQMSWSGGTGEFSPWLKLFLNARRFVD